MEEVSLRDLIEVLLRGKWVIAIVTIAAVITSGVLSFFVLPPVYEASATLMVNQPGVQPNLEFKDLEPGLAYLLSSLVRYPQMTVESYRVQAENPVVLSRVISRLQLPMTVEELARRVEARAAKDTNLLELAVSARQPAEAARLANAMAEEFLRYVAEVNREQMARSSEFVAEEMRVEEEKLGQALEELKGFLQQPRGVDELEAEMEAKIKLLSTQKARKTEVEVEIGALQAAVERGRAEMQSQPRVILTRKSITDDPYLQQLAEKLGNTDLLHLSGLSMESEQVNEAYTALGEEVGKQAMELAKLEGERGSLGEAIARTEKELEQLRAELAEKKVAQERLQQKVDTLKKANLALIQKYEETRMAQSERMAQQALTLVAEAVEPTRPVKPRKALNVAVAGTLGVMVSVFMVFFMEFWRNTSPGGHTGTAGPGGPAAGSVAGGSTMSPAGGASGGTVTGSPARPGAPGKA